MVKKYSYMPPHLVFDEEGGVMNEKADIQAPVWCFMRVDFLVTELTLLKTLFILVCKREATCGFKSWSGLARVVKMESYCVLTSTCIKRA